MADTNVGSSQKRQREGENDEHRPKRQRQTEPTTIEQACDTANENTENMEMLGIWELYEMAKSNNEEKTAIRLTFAQKYASNLFSFDRNLQHAIDITESDICVSDLSIFLKVLHFFGDVISKLRINYNDLSQSEAANLFATVNEYCGDTLLEIDVCSFNRSIMNDLKQPFGKVKAVKFSNCELGSRLTDFNRWFPKMQSLTFGEEVTVIDCKCIEVNFPHLNTLEITAMEVQKQHFFEELNIAKLLSFNSHLRHLELCSDFLDHKFLQSVSKHLQHLETLAIVWDCGPDYACDNIRFSIWQLPLKKKIHLKNVKEFTLSSFENLDYSHCCRIQQIPFTFDRLDKFKFIVMANNENYEETLVDELDSFILNHKTLKSVTLHCDLLLPYIPHFVNYDLNVTLRLFIVTCSSLEEINISCKFNFIDDIEDFFTDCNSLKVLRLGIGSDITFNDLLEKYGNEWQISIDGKYAEFKRKAMPRATSEYEASDDLDLSDDEGEIEEYSEDWPNSSNDDHSENDIESSESSKSISRQRQDGQNEDDAEVVKETNETELSDALDIPEDDSASNCTDTNSVESMETNEQSTSELPAEFDHTFAINKFMSLDFVDFLKAADSNLQRNHLITAAFSNNYQTNCIHFMPPHNLSQKTDSIVIDDSSKCLPFLHYFGQFIRKVILNFEQKSDDDLGNHLNKYCTDSLTEIKIHHATEKTMQDLEIPFSRIETLEFNNSKLNCRLTDFNRWFGRVRNLKFASDVIVIDRKCIEMTFPHLENLSVTDDTFDKECIVETVRLNPQLRSLAIGMHTMDAKFMQSIADYGHLLEYLEIQYCECERDFGSESIHFKNVKELKLIFEDTDQNIPLSFDLLNKLTIKSEWTGYGIAEFSRKHSTITCLTLDMKYGLLRWKFAKELPQLKEICFMGDVYTIGNIIDLLIDCKLLKSLQKIGFVLHERDTIDELRKYLHGDWNASIDDGKIMLERAIWNDGQ